jgi:regulator of sigma E protease
VKPAESEAAVDDAQLSLGAWLVRNGPVVSLMILGLVLVYWWLGPDGMLNAAMVVIGLGLVIFIHELGHFLVAKWCDVHVETFSIGFGPALPGCSFKRGETTYKIALFPLGGYVKMLGEGGENDEEDTDPRSYKNKAVGQRMAIISAGVAMNVVLGLICFIVAFKVGVFQMAPVVGVVEPGGPAWTKAVRSGDVFEQIDDIANPSFEDLKIKVMLTGPGQSVRFVLDTPGQESRTLTIEPRKLKNEPNPVIGVLWPFELKLREKRYVSGRPGPVRRGSPAAAARVLDLQPGDQVLATTDPEHPQDTEHLLAMPPPPSGQTFDYQQLAQRLRRLVDLPLILLVKRDTGQQERITVPPIGFEFEDSIVGTSDDEAVSPFQVKLLPMDARDPQGQHRDYFEFLKRMKRLQDRPAVIQVRRKKEASDAAPVNVFVPPAYHRDLLGVRMVMGRVSAVREGSTAEQKGIKPRDIITHVELTAGKDRVRFATHPEHRDDRLLDPVRLPSDLRAWAIGRQSVKATVTVKRVQGTEEQKAQVVPDLSWDYAWEFDEEQPLVPNASLSIPELGIAYQVKSTVEDVAPGSPAAGRLFQGDVILAVNVLQPPRKPGESESWPDTPVMDLRAKGDPSPDPAPRWANVFYTLQEVEIPRIRLLVRHTPTRDEGPGAVTEEKVIELSLTERDLHSASPWPLHDPLEVRGLLRLLEPQERIVRASTLTEAVRMGMRHTIRTVVHIYLSLKSLVTGRVSVGENIAGPIRIAEIAYITAGRDWANLTLLLGIISVNLAVINFLPIPILDGGHMIFLIYEKFRGRPASETVRMAANWFGLVLLVSLMLFVTILDLVRIVLQ